MVQHMVLLISPAHFAQEEIRAGLPVQRDQHRKH